MKKFIISIAALAMAAISTCAQVNIGAGYSGTSMNPSEGDDPMSVLVTTFRSVSDSNSVRQLNTTTSPTVRTYLQESQVQARHPKTVSTNIT